MPSGMGPGVWKAQRDYNDPLQYYRMTERFIGGNNGSANAATHDWYRSGVTASGAAGLNMALLNTESGASGVKGIVADVATNHVTRWSLYNRDVGIARAGTIITVRVRPQVAPFSDNFAWSFGIQQGTGANPLQATDTQFVGIRAQSTIDANVYAVIKDGAGAGSESTVSLGAFDASAWHTYRVVVGATAAAGYRDGVMMGSTADLDDFNVAGTYASHMMAYNEAASDGSQRIVNVTLFDVIVPTGGW